MPFPYGKIRSIARSDVSIAWWGDGGHGSAVSLPQNDRSPDRDVSIAWWGKIIARPIGCKHRLVGRWRTRQCRFPTAKSSLARSDVSIAWWGDGGHGSAVSLPQNDRSPDRDVSIAQYGKIIARPIGCKHRLVGRWRTRQCRFLTKIQDTAVPFPYKNTGHGSAVSLQKCRTRQCRFPTNRIFTNV